MKDKELVKSFRAWLNERIVILRGYNKDYKSRKALLESKGVNPNSQLVSEIKKEIIASDNAIKMCYLLIDSFKKDHAERPIADLSELYNLLIFYGKEKAIPFYNLTKILGMGIASNKTKARKKELTPLEYIAQYFDKNGNVITKMEVTDELVKNMEKVFDKCTYYLILSDDTSVDIRHFIAVYIDQLKANSEISKMIKKEESTRLKANEELKEYYANGEIISVCTDIKAFREMLASTTLSIDEKRKIEYMMNKALKQYYHLDSYSHTVSRFISFDDIVYYENLKESMDIPFGCPLTDEEKLLLEQIEYYISVLNSKEIDTYDNAKQAQIKQQLDECFGKLRENDEYIHQSDGLASIVSLNS